LPPRPQIDEAPPASQLAEDDPTGSEPRQQPELNRIRPVEMKIPIDNEFEIDPADDADDDVSRNSHLNRVMQGVARQVSLDPGDGMDL
jgi:type IV secretion system protein VirD4